MKTYTMMETESYILNKHEFASCELIRKADGASTFFQGDDFDLWSDNMSAIERCYKDDETGLIGSFNFMCSGYDEILHV